MQTTGNTVFITGGGSGIGRGLAEALHRRGNQVVISGRRRAQLDDTVRANPGMRAFELDVTDAADIGRVARQLIGEYPALNVLVNNAGIMRIDDAAVPMDDAQLAAIVTTNLLGPIRMTSALIDHLKTREHATIIHMSSGLGFVPMAMTSVYCATKAALHSYALSQRFQLRHSGVTVVEIAPPWVQTDLMGPTEDPRAMKLAAFIDDTMAQLETGVDEVLVGQATMLRANPGPNERTFFERFNSMMQAH